MEAKIKKGVLFLRFGLLILLVTVFICCLNSKSYAVNNLQVYIPGTAYIDPDSDPWIHQSWVASSSPFELWVIAANDDIDDVYLTMAVASGETGNIHLVSLTSPFPPAFPGTTFSSFNNGNPGYAPHGVYDTPYAELSIGNIIVGADQVYDMVDGGDPKDGKIVKFTVTVTDFSRVHFDARGDGLKQNGNAVTNAPYSHDSTYISNSVPTEPIPEPTTLSLLGLGLLGLYRIKRKLK